MVEIHPDDPAAALWKRCPPAELSAVWDLFNDVPVQVGSIAQRLGLVVVSKTLSSDISGSIRRDGEAYRIEVNNTDAGVRQRFTVCHEISHYLLHCDFIDLEGITDSILFRSRLSNKLEVEANKLAAAMLLPWVPVIEWHAATFGGAPRIENLDAIAANFRTSRLAVGFRFGF